MSRHMVASRRLGKALIDAGILPELTTTAEICTSVDGALFVRSERFITTDELPKIAEAFAALAKEAGE